jgi:hypothetical protein
MKRRSKLSEWKRNLREIYLFSDTELLEIAIILTVVFINPFQLDIVPGLPLWWEIAGIAGAVTNFLGLLNHNLALRYWGVKIVWTYLLVMLAQCIWCWCWSTDMITFIIQLIVVWFVLWKTKKQLEFCRSRRKKCK